MTTYAKARQILAVASGTMPRPAPLRVSAAAALKARKA